MQFVISDPSEWETRLMCAEEPADQLGRFANAETDEEIKECLDICRTCPSLPKCELWGWERRKILVGVVGGVFYSPGGLVYGKNRRGMRRDLFWLEGKRASDMGKCERCNTACAGRCDRLIARGRELGLNPSDMVFKPTRRRRESDRIRDGQHGKEYLCYTCEKWQDAEVMIKNPLTPSGIAGRCKACAKAIRQRKTNADGWIGSKVGIAARRVG